jgi:ribosomal protein S18 acetylase RimI-like enzyme
MDYTIRSADADDVDGIRRVARAAWTAAYADVLGEEVTEALIREAHATDAVADAVEDDDVVFLVADADEGVVGYLTAGPGGGDGAELYDISVDPEHWRENVARKMLGIAKGQVGATGFDSLRARVLAENDAVGFFEATNLERVDERTVSLAGTECRELLYEQSLAR